MTKKSSEKIDMFYALLREEIEKQLEQADKEKAEKELAAEKSKNKPTQMQDLLNRFYEELHIASLTNSKK